MVSLSIFNSKEYKDMKKGMLKIFVDVLVLVGILVVIDLVVGYLGDGYANWLNQEPRNGDAALINYDLNAATPDVAIIGSSTAICHYVPDIIHDSLLVATNIDYEVFNMGMSKQKMAYNYYALKGLVERKKPSIVIEDVWASNVSVGDHPLYYQELRPYVNSNHNVKEMFERHGAYNFLLKSKMYCYNTELVKMLMSFMKPKGADGYKGSNVEMAGIVKLLDKDTTAVLTESADEFDNMIKLCKSNSIKLFVVLSPALHASDTTSASYTYIKKKCHANGIPFLDYSNDNRFYQSHYFCDPLHMNSYGAEFFTAELMKDIKPYLSESN